MNQQIALAKLSEYHKMAIIFGTRAITALIVFLVFWFIAFLLSRAILRLTKKHPQKLHIFKVIANSVKITILLLGIITALGSAGLNVSAIVASLGLTGFAISFALKDYLSSILAGFMILIYQPYKVGQNIEVGNSKGKVEEINLRYTVLTAEGRTILIPNSSMLSSTVSILA